MRVKKMVSILALAVVGLTGCKTTLNATFVQAVQEHRQDTVLVNQSLINALQEEMENENRPAAKVAYQEIINNLQAISHQAEILEKYTWNELTEDELAMVLRAKWRAKQ